MKRNSLGVLLALLLAVLAKLSSANPVVPARNSEVPPVPVTVQPSLGEMLAEIFGEGSIGYCGGDPVNHSDPMGTKWHWVQNPPPPHWQWQDDGDGPEPPTGSDGSIDLASLPSGMKEVYETPWHEIVAVPDLAGYQSIVGRHNEGARNIKAFRERMIAEDAARAAAEVERRKHWNQLTLDEKVGGIQSAVAPVYQRHAAFMKEGIFIGLDLVTAGETGWALGAVEKGVSLGTKVVERLAQEGEEKVAQKLLTVAPKWTGKVINYKKGAMAAIEHIFYRHGPESGFAGVGRFAAGTDAKAVVKLVEEAAARGTWEAQSKGYKIIYDVGKQIGTHMDGSVASKVEVYLNEAFEVLTAYPVK